MVEIIMWLFTAQDKCNKYLTKPYDMNMQNSDILASLEQVINQRLTQDDDAPSYVRSLNIKGIDAILKKIGEEATEVIIAGKSGEKKDIIYESCDLLFHLMVLLGHEKIALSDIQTELQRRFGMSGIAEKASRSN